MGSRIAGAAIVLVAVAAIVDCWTTFSQVIDEPAHVAAGVEWLDDASYTLEPQHPPLARIFTAVGPKLRGAHYTPQPHWLFSGNAILYGNGDYVTTLASARAGTLPFFLLACAIVAAWAYRLYGGTAALIALLLFALQPAVLAHAALATNDMAAAATIAAALFAAACWIERPSHARAVMLGLALAAALTAKFSAVVFLPAALVAMLAVERMRPRKEHTSFAAAIVIAALVILAIYRFQPGFLAGIADVGAHNREGHPGYLFGQVRRDGWWYYQPVALWFKSTLPLLIAFVFGAYTLVRRRTSSLIPLAAAAAILAVAMVSRISIGVRHVLPLYPLVAIVAAYGVMQLRRPFAIALLVAQVASFALAHPDHLAYFNVTAGRDPSRILLDSNLDWGQDIFRLEEAAARHRIDTLHIALFTSADLRRHPLPRLRPLPPFQTASGWIAVSEMHQKDVGARGRRHGGYDWLRRYEPVERVGKSILLYSVP